VKDFVLESVVEKDGGVTLRGFDRVTKKPLEHRASRVFLATGCIATTKVLLKSLDAYDRPIWFCDSQHFFVPFLQFRGTKGTLEEKAHTMAQLFVEILDREVSEHLVHLQMYSFNELYLLALKRLFGPTYFLASPFVDAFLERLWIILGYFHSKGSPRVKATLSRGGAGRDVFRLEGEPATKERVERVLRKLRAHRGAFGGLPVGFMTKVRKPGGGHHFGATFPMREKPGPFESDLVGRPHGFTRVHAVDSTVFPSIPATTITLTIMANAHRIGSTWRDE
jgi:hypothetical protein